MGPLIAPPGDLSAPLPGQTGRLKDANGVPIMPPAKGMKLGSMLFKEDIRDEGKRFERVENAVQEMRQEFDALLPSLIRLVALEKDIQGLTSQLDAMLGNQPSPLIPEDGLASNSPPGIQSEALSPAPLTPAGPPSPATAAVPENTEPIATPPPSPAEAPPPPPPQASPPTAASAPVTPAVTLEDLRLSESSGKTRLVISLSAEAGYAHALSGEPPTLRITLENTQLSEAARAKKLASALVKSWRHETGPDGKSAVLTFDLSPGASVARVFTIGSEEGHNLRLVFDIQ